MLLVAAAAAASRAAVRAGCVRGEGVSRRALLHTVNAHDVEEWCQRLNYGPEVFFAVQLAAQLAIRSRANGFHHELDRMQRSIDVDVDSGRQLQLKLHEDHSLENVAGAVIWDAALVLIHYLSINSESWVTGV